MELKLTNLSVTVTHEGEKALFFTAVKEFSDGSSAMFSCVTIDNKMKKVVKGAEKKGIKIGELNLKASVSEHEGYFNLNFWAAD